LPNKAAQKGNQYFHHFPASSVAFGTNIVVVVVGMKTKNYLFKYTLKMLIYRRQYIMVEIGFANGNENQK
jgi:hypothetical protein